MSDILENIEERREGHSARAGASGAGTDGNLDLDLEKSRDWADLDLDLDFSKISISISISAFQKSRSRSRLLPISKKHFRSISKKFLVKFFPVFKCFQRNPSKFTIVSVETAQFTLETICL